MFVRLKSAEASTQAIYQAKHSFLTHVHCHSLIFNVGACFFKLFMALASLVSALKSCWIKAACKNISDEPLNVSNRRREHERLAVHCRAKLVDTRVLGGCVLALLRYFCISLEHILVLEYIC